MRYSFDDATAEERRRTQYFEMVGNRGIYHEGWTAVTRHGVPWKMTEEPRPFDGDTWELYDTRADWSQANDVAADDPERLARLQALFDEEAEKHQVFPLDDRVTARENPEVAGRHDLYYGRSRVVLGRHTGRLTEETAPNVKNRSHRITISLDIPADHPPQSTNGVLVAQGGRFGGWSLYVVAGHLHYAYNRYGKDITVVRAESVLWRGEHEVVLDFRYDGGPHGSGGEATILVDGGVVAQGRIEATTAYYFAFDESFNVGIDRGSPVVDDYPALRNAFTGEIREVVVDLDIATVLDAETTTRLAVRAQD